MTPDWLGLPRLQILDTCFKDGLGFLRTWHTWQHTTDRPRMLHVVALCPRAPTSETLVQACGSDTNLLPLANELVAHWFGLLPGFHRFLLANGQVTLTLCVGDALQALRQHTFLADEVCVALDAPEQPGEFDAHNPWAIKALARCCRRGTTLYAHLPTSTDASDLHQQLCSSGFAISDNSTDAERQFQARFDPPWPLKTSRQNHSSALPVQRCAVVGAGLAGASVAAALARRGWQVLVLDAAPAPAAGASGLPVGLVVPHTSSDDCPLSRLSRAGVRLTLQQARQHLQPGTQWAATGVLERQVGGTPQLPSHWQPEGQDWSISAPDKLADGPGLWHPRAAWIQPAALVSAWLKQPGVRFQGGAKVCHVQHIDGVWQLLDEAQQVLCCAERVVFANAGAARPLLDNLAHSHPDLSSQLQRLPSTQGMRGLLSWALHSDSTADKAAFPPFPVNGFSGLVSHVPTDQGPAWFMGSSYQPEQQVERPDADNHVRNWEHLKELLPSLAGPLAANFASKNLQTWKGTRCISADRLPLVGPLDAGAQPSLWLCAALGSRGLSFSVLCAELLAAQMGAEPLPVEAKLAKALHALRG
ncbi:FAD-dependent oxidoreductase [Rhodoferax sp. BLA1]|uniref:FAD-dependent oxidoreductase n=1 Tax=Rhodoferax sp. BLA1 TaxID=2576062 RepID=UPI0015D0EA20|nr:FAD-dependent oxidoreductase [Rhodoferax sp. BLA1]